MQSAKWGILLASLFVAFSVAVAIADDAAPATQPSTDTEAPKPKVKLFKPYSLLTDLTDDQKAKIAAIHKTYNEALAALKAKQTSDIEALLTDDQKKELTDAVSASGEEAKATQTETKLEQKVNTDQEKLDKVKAAAGNAGTGNSN